jgi:hypothetical protein
VIAALGCLDEGSIHVGSSVGDRLGHLHPTTLPSPRPFKNRTVAPGPRSQGEPGIISTWPTFAPGSARATR